MLVSAGSGVVAVVVEEVVVGITVVTATAHKAKFDVDI